MRANPRPRGKCCGHDIDGAARLPDLHENLRHPSLFILLQRTSTPPARSLVAPTAAVLLFLAAGSSVFLRLPLPKPGRLNEYKFQKSSGTNAIMYGGFVCCPRIRIVGILVDLPMGSCILPFTPLAPLTLRCVHLIYRSKRRPGGVERSRYGSWAMFFSLRRGYHQLEGSGRDMEKSMPTSLWFDVGTGSRLGSVGPCFVHDLPMETTRRVEYPADKLISASWPNNPEARCAKTRDDMAMSTAEQDELTK
ncbi:hypothetical protein MSAN_00417700 [Mycena sanguinolenta]|uniref:Uncharacterized protein n=1 Tax=Mycena sanguinolenta TaxID=230812 RepID=A0A8H7DH81_9AGAR|nr:hypothetical protein MSAN_00417700 [Mycena sanguinolenta]